MKLISKSIIIFFFTGLHLTHAVQPKFMILFSGNPSKKYRELLNKSLHSALPESSQLSLFEDDNPTCKRREKYLIQFCLNGDDLRVIHQNKPALQRTLSKLIKMEDLGGIKKEAHIIKAFQ